MAQGRLGKAVLAAATNASVYTPNVNCKYAKVSVNVLNTNATAAVFQMAISTTGTPAAADYIENGVNIPASGGVLSRTEVIVGRDEQLIVQSNLAGVVVRGAGEEII